MSCPVDSDPWMRPAINSDRTSCYEYVLLYVDAALVVSENDEHILWNEMVWYGHLKEEMIGPPKIYLGGHVCKVQLENGVSTWSFNGSQYLQTAVKTVKEYVLRSENQHLKLPRKAQMSLMTLHQRSLG